MAQEAQNDLAYYMAESRRHLFAGNKREALGCYILGRDLAGLRVEDQTRRDYLCLLQLEQAGKR
jgi:hypothetical protein